MAPNLRSSSSTQSTPTGKSGSASATSRDTTPSTTPRKVPQCQKCKRPRAGHPRSGCPYVDSPLKDEDMKMQPLPASHITVALGSMHLESPVRDRDEETKATIRNRHRLSAQPVPVGPTESLASVSSEALAALLKPGMFDDTSDEEEAVHNVAASGSAKVVRWQETLAAIAPAKGKGKAFSRSPMPGTLISPSPSPESSFTSQWSSMKQETPLAKISASTSVTAPSTPQLLGRTMSLQQREDFISALTSKSTATIYVLPKADIKAIAEAAGQLNFHSSVVNDLEDDTKEQGLLILGRSEEAVKRVMEKMEEEEKKQQAKHHLEMIGNEQQQEIEKSKASGAGGSKLRAAAGGAVVGAVGAWAGLAFS